MPSPHTGGGHTPQSAGQARHVSPSSQMPSLHGATL